MYRGILVVFTDIDKPKIDDIDVREDYVVVSWKPSADRPSNPASEFVVEYRPEGMDHSSPSHIDH